MGLGLYEYGSGISATKFLISQGAKVLVTDLKTRKDLAVSIKRLGKVANKVTFVLGKHRVEDFKNVDLIIRNPGVPKSSKYLQIAKKAGVPIETDISLFFQLINRKRIIGITGTRGKSTTTSLIYDIFKLVDKDAVLGGNITKSPLSQMSQVKKGGKVILELSSWLLEGLESPKLSPYIAVVTNIYPDHLNTYQGIKDYAKAKEYIWKYQNAQDAVILNRDNAYTREMGSRVPSRRFWFSLKELRNENGCFIRNKAIWFRQEGEEKRVLPVSDIKVPGQHSVANVLSAVCVAMVYGIEITKIKQAVKRFNGIADRLEFLKQVKGVKYYNDTTSTTPEAGVAALKALGSGKNIVLIAGGSDKGLDFKPWLKEVKKSCKALILLEGTGTDRIRPLISNFQFPISIANSMSDAIGIAKSYAKSDDIILLSPACASFGMFKNEFDRGEQFRDLVEKL